MSSSNHHGTELECITKCRHIQNMINLTIDEELLPLRRLYGDTLDRTPEECDVAESKLCAFYAEQMNLLLSVSNAELEQLDNPYPKTDQWLMHVVELDESAVLEIIKHHNLLNLIQREVVDLRSLLSHYAIDDYKVERCIRYSEKLHKYYQDFASLRSCLIEAAYPSTGTKSHTPSPQGSEKKRVSVTEYRDLTPLSPKIFPHSHTDSPESEKVDYDYVVSAPPTPNPFHSRSISGTPPLQSPASGSITPPPYKVDLPRYPSSENFPKHSKIKNKPPPIPSTTSLHKVHVNTKSASDLLDSEPPLSPISSCRGHKFQEAMTMGGKCDTCSDRIFATTSRRCTLCNKRYHKKCVAQCSLCEFANKLLDKPMTHNIHMQQGMNGRADSSSNPSSSNTPSTPRSPLLTNTQSSNKSKVFVFDPDSNEESISTLRDEDDSGVHRTSSMKDPLKRFEIPYHELSLKDELGQGHFCKVYRGLWHGEVAIKQITLPEQLDEDSKTLMRQAFESDIKILLKVRHENLVLFMGVSFASVHLNIVSALCKGPNLYSALRDPSLRDTRFTTNKCLSVAQQIAQGMGYLHSRDIVHRDLRSKNVFLEMSNKVVISDYGLFNWTRMGMSSAEGGFLQIPHGWLCYLAPEIIRSLHSHSSQELAIPFSKETDIFAFGTLWYELMTKQWPYKDLPVEAVIWKAGKGILQSLGDILVPSNYKDVMLKCWTFEKTARPSFADLNKTLGNLPKIIRSPSYPERVPRRHHDFGMT